jgi:16S rRNA (cytidine1402-2'-O)-methyltransferase
MTVRGVEVLRVVDLVACEDTRTSATLLKHYGIDTPRTSFHQHNEHRKTSDLVDRLVRGESLALISDAGTPSISDPGFLLVRAALEAGVPVTALPGATALVPALTASGLPSDRFVFEGFLPPKKGRRKRLEMLAAEDRTMVFYVSPHRITRDLTDFAKQFGPSRRAVLAREISKIHESYVRGTLEEIRVWVADRERVKGELVLVIAGADYQERMERVE